MPRPRIPMKYWLRAVRRLRRAMWTRQLTREQHREITETASVMRIHPERFMEFLERKKLLPEKQAAAEAVQQIRELHEMAESLGYLHGEKTVKALQDIVKHRGVEGALAFLQQQAQMQESRMAA